MIPDWQLPPGTDRGVWDYTHNPELARTYDTSLAGTPLLEFDLQYCEQQFSQPGTLIDLGCGTGRLALLFAARGYQCTALDLSAAMLEQVKQKAEARGLKIDYLEKNLVELDDTPAEQFDYAGCLFSTWGMIRGRENRQTFLKHVHRILKPDGKFVLHAHNRGYHLFRLVGLPWAIRDGMRSLRGQEPGEYPMPQIWGGAKLTLHHFSVTEIEKDLREAGFKIRDFKPISTRLDGTFKLGWAKRLRAYGFLICCEKLV